jgi:hypothetical protein
VRSSQFDRLDEMLYRILDRATYTQAITALALSNIERTLSG